MGRENDRLSGAFLSERDQDNTDSSVLMRYEINPKEEKSIGESEGYETKWRFFIIHGR